MLTLSIIDVAIIVFGGLLFVYQALYTVVGIVAKPTVFPDAKPKKYGVITSARNEENVIGQLIKNIQSQDYDQSCLDIWVIADNCTDNTAKVARELGANVVERFDESLIGKGYALTYFFDYLIKNDLLDNYDGFCILDTDNILKKDFFKEMNKVFCAGNKIVTSYRNTTNFSENWLSASGGLWFIRESRLVNYSRQALGYTCHVGGTGFLFATELIKNNNGWPYHLITEDLQFTVDSIIKGYKIAYCHTAMLYDEQPTKFLQYVRQRLRWAHGFMEVFVKFSPKLIVNCFRTHSFAGVEVLLMVFPWTLIIVVRALLGFLYAQIGFVSWMSQINVTLSLLLSTVTAIVGVFAFTVLAVILDRKNVDATNKQLVWFMLMYPIFLLSYIPISFAAVFKKVEWKPIHHTGNATFDKSRLDSDSGGNDEDKDSGDKDSGDGGSTEEDAGKASTGGEKPSKATSNKKSATKKTSGKKTSGKEAQDKAGSNKKKPVKASSVK